MNSPEQIFVSVVVCAFNEEKLLRSCLDGLAAQTYPRDRYEVLVIDDESTDKTFDIASEFIADLPDDAPHMRLVSIQHAGLSVARNAGIQLSEGDVIAFIDGDAVATKSWILDIANEFASSNSPKIIGGLVCLLNKDSKFASLLYGSFFSHYMKSKHSIIGTNMAFSKTLLNEKAPFHPSFVSRGDETYIFDKLKPRAVPVQISGAAVYHESPESLKAWLKSRYDNGYFAVLLDIMNANDVDTKKRLFLKIVNRILFLVTPIIIILSLIMKLNVLLYLGVFSYLVITFRRYLTTGYLKDLMKHFWAQKAINLPTKLYSTPIIILLLIIGYYYSDFASIISFWKYRKHQWL